MKRTRNKKWRHVYPYTCTGCGRRRIAFVYERAHKGICTRCEEPEVDKDQGKLFDPPMGEGITITTANVDKIFEKVRAEQERGGQQ